MLKCFTKNTGAELVRHIIYANKKEEIQQLNQLMSQVAFFAIVLLLLLGQAQADYGVDIVGPMSATAFGCLQQQGMEFAFIRAYKLFDTYGDIDPEAIQTLTNSQRGGVPTDIYMVICRNNDSTSQINTIINGIPSSLYSTIWIKVEPNNTPGCSWQGYSQEDNCIFLIEAVIAVSNNNQTAGVFSTSNIWGRFFGDTCNFIGALSPQVYLWYADYTRTGQVNVTQSFASFIPFGGWSQPIIKQVKGNVHVTLCGYPLWHALVDIDWY